jgi:phospholipase C
MKLTAKLLFLFCFCGAMLAHAQISNFQHVIVIVQENRTPDNLFQGLCTAPFGNSKSCSTTPTGSQYNIQTKDWVDKTSSTGTTQPALVQLENNYDPDHAHLSFTKTCDLNTKTGGRRR